MSQELRYCVERIYGNSAHTVTSYSDYRTACEDCKRRQKSDPQATYEVWDDAEGDVVFTP